MRKIFIYGCISYCLIGFAHLVMGSVLTDLVESYQRDYSDGGKLIFLQFSGFLIGVITTPWWLRRLGRRGALLLSCGLLCLAELVYALHPAWGWMLTVAPFAGFGFGMIEAVIGALVIESAESAQKAVAMSRLEVFFGVGSLIMPFASSILIHYGAWKSAFYGISGLALVMFVLWGCSSFGKHNELMSTVEPVQTGTLNKPSRFFGSRGMTAALCLFILMFFLYVGLEMSFVSFLPPLLMEKTNVGKEAATLGNTLFWGTMVIGRMYAGVIAEKISFFKYWAWSAICTLAVFGALLSITNVWLAFVAVGLLGLFMSGMFAIGLVYADQTMPGRTERVTSLLIASGGVGGAVFPMVSGSIMDHGSAYQSIVMFVLLTIGMLAALLAVRWISAKVRIDREGANRSQGVNHEAM